MGNKEIFNAACRSDFYAFLQKAFTVIERKEFKGNWHLELFADRLQLCAERKIKRVMVMVPPRNLKSHCVSVCLPAYILGHDPSAKIICVSYSQNFADKLSRKTKKLMESKFYKSIFKTRLGDKQTESEFETTENGSRYATSIGGSLTGNGGNYIIIDDPIKADDACSETIRNNVNDWYSNTLVSRLDDQQDGVIILVMQRLHINDLAGRLLKQGGWEVISLPAIAERNEMFTLSDGRVVGRQAGSVLNPKRDSLEIFKRIKQIQSSYNFSAQYQQRPIPMKGNIIDFGDFQYYDKLPDGGKIFQSWDIALKDGVKNDYSVCVTAKHFNNVLYVDNVFRRKLDMSDLIKEMYRMCNVAEADHVIIEDSSVTTHLIQHLKNERIIYPIPCKPRGDKVSRANHVPCYIKSGRILLRKGAPWLDDLKAEINAFPHGKHDDQVDALTQLVNYVLTNGNTGENKIVKLRKGNEHPELKKLTRALRNNGWSCDVI